MDMIKGFLQDISLFVYAVTGIVVVSIYMIYKYSEIEVSGKGLSFNAKKAEKSRKTIENVGNDVTKKGNQAGNNSKETKNIKLKEGHDYKNVGNTVTTSGNSTNCTTEKTTNFG